MSPRTRTSALTAAAILTVGLVAPLRTAGQAPAAAPQAGRGGQAAPAPQFVSPEVLPDRRIVFRLYAPDATAVTFRGGDVPAASRGDGQLKKGENGVWELTTGPVEPGAYRYVFVMNNVGIIDPRNPVVSESNATSWSLVTVPGSDVMDTTKVPHGAVASVTYYSTALGRHRRMHVYTPPGYENGKDRYPVFYLLHGAGDSDDSWTSVGRAGFILDNLIATGKAKPMIVVMPAGHTNAGGGAARRGAAPGRQPPPARRVHRGLRDRPHAVRREELPRDRRSRASRHRGPLDGRQPDAEHRHSRISTSSPTSACTARACSAAADAAAARRPRAGTHRRRPSARHGNSRTSPRSTTPRAKKGLKLLLVRTGVDDGLITTTRQTVELLKRHGFSPVFKESPGAHTWLNWRAYLDEFTPQLFQESRGGTK